jgi:hypothetical protein
LREPFGSLPGPAGFLSQPWTGDGGSVGPGAPKFFESGNTLWFAESVRVYDRATENRRIGLSQTPGRQRPTHHDVSELIRPHQTDAAISHTHSFDGFSRGLEKPAPHSFFGPVANALKDAGRILIFGSGCGFSNEMDQFVAWLKIHHPELARRVAGSLIIDEHHLTNAQLLAKARDFYALPRVSPSSTP